MANMVVFTLMSSMCTVLVKLMNKLTLHISQSGVTFQEVSRQSTKKKDISSSVSPKHETKMSLLRSLSLLPALPLPLSISRCLSLTDPHHLHSPKPLPFMSSLLSISKRLLRASGGTITESRATLVRTQDLEERERGREREQERERERERGVSERERAGERGGGREWGGNSISLSSFK